MKILPFTTNNLEFIKNYLADNKVVILPTDTIYGLHVRFNPENLAVINQAKHRSANQPCNAIYSNIDQIKHLITKTEHKTINLLCNISGLTMIVSGETPTGQAIRRIHPSFKVLFALLEKIGPLYSTSANISTIAYSDNIKDIQVAFPDITLFMKQSSYVSRETILPSTIIDIRNKDIKLIRQGSVSREIIAAALNR